MARKREQSTKPASSSSQLTSLPGTTFEDIFKPVAKASPKQMTGADWDAILGRQPRTTKEEQ